MPSRIPCANTLPERCSAGVGTDPGYSCTGDGDGADDDGLPIPRRGTRIRSEDLTVATRARGPDQPEWPTVPLKWKPSVNTSCSALERPIAG